MSDRSDDFNRANNASAIGTPSDGGSAWNNSWSTWGINGNRAYEASGATSALATVDSGTSAVEVQVTVAVMSSNAGVCARLSDFNNFIEAQIASVNGLSLFKRVGGTYTQLGSTYSYTPASGDVVKLRLDAANSITAYVNGVARIGPLTDSAGAANTKHGLWAYSDNTSRFDTFSITDITAGAVSQKLIFFSRQAVNRSAVL